MKNKIYLSIITLSKNDNKNFQEPLKAYFLKRTSNNIELLIIDGSNKNNQKQ